MDVNPLIRKGTNILQSYKGGAFKVAGELYDHPIILGETLLQPWDGSFDNLPPHDVLLVGTGDTQIWPSAEIRARVPMDVMATPAACRTYNALISEGRDVVALLVPVSP